MRRQLTIPYYHTQPSERGAQWAGKAGQLSSARLGFPLLAELGSVTGGSGGHLDDEHLSLPLLV